VWWIARNVKPGFIALLQTLDLDEATLKIDVLHIKKSNLVLLAKKI